MSILDPDGDIVRRLKKSGQAKRFSAWPCYHTHLYTFPLGEQTIGIIGCVVGVPFAVLVAAELLACGCRILISLASAGQMGLAERDFEKGEADGTADALRMLETVATALRSRYAVVQI
jgi:hypothetical protein